MTATIVKMMMGVGRRSSLHFVEEVHWFSLYAFLQKHYPVSCGWYLIWIHWHETSNSYTDEIDYTLFWFIKYLFFCLQLCTGFVMSEMVKSFSSWFCFTLTLQNSTTEPTLHPSVLPLSSLKFPIKENSSIYTRKTAIFYHKYYKK